MNWRADNVRRLFARCTRTKTWPIPLPNESSFRSLPPMRTTASSSGLPVDLDTVSPAMSRKRGGGRACVVRLATAWLAGTATSAGAADGRERR